MVKLECPHCRHASIGWWRKQVLGPARTISCPNCAASVSVSWKHAAPIIVAPVLVGVFLGFVGPIIREQFTPDWRFALNALVIVLALIVIGVYHHFLVPLEVRSRPPAERLAELQEP